MNLADSSECKSSCGVAYRLSESQVGVKERLHGSNIFPVVIEQVGNDLLPLSCCHGDDLTPKVVGARVLVLQQLHQDVLLEDIDTHGGDEGLLAGLLIIQTCHMEASVTWTVTVT